jgi:hypothetical protein
MGIFRGPGGTGDATGDATNQASIAIAAANTATSAATSASNSAISASNSAIAAAASAASIDPSLLATLTGTETLTNKTISGADNTLSNIGNTSLTNSSLTVNGTSIALGASDTITAANPSALTIGTGLSGTSYDGGSAVTVAIDSTVATLTDTQTLTNKTISGVDNTLTNVSLTTAVTGTLPVDNGGTGLTSVGTSGNIIRSNGTAFVSESPIASTAEAETGTNNTQYLTPLRLREGVNATGTAPVYAARAWVNFNGTGTVAILASGNVSSITDNGTGDYSVNFTTAMPDANYSSQANCSKHDTTNDGNTRAQIGGFQGNLQTASSTRVRVSAGNATTPHDALMVFVVIFR